MERVVAKIFLSQRLVNGVETIFYGLRVGCQVLHVLGIYSGSTALRRPCTGLNRRHGYHCSSLFRGGRNYLFAKDGFPGYSSKSL